MTKQISEMLHSGDTSFFLPEHPLVDAIAQEKSTRRKFELASVLADDIAGTHPDRSLHIALHCRLWEARQAGIALSELDPLFSQIGYINKKYTRFAYACGGAEDFGLLQTLSMDRWRMHPRFILREPVSVIRVPENEPHWTSMQSPSETISQYVNMARVRDASVYFGTGALIPVLRAKRAACEGVPFERLRVFVPNNPYVRRSHLEELIDCLRCLPGAPITKRFSFGQLTKADIDRSPSRKRIEDLLEKTGIEEFVDWMEPGP